MFDNVKIARTRLTERLGYANQDGVCFGFTTPSVTGVEVIGEHDDLALNVHFDDLEDAWFTPDLVEFISHGAGVETTVGDKRFIIQDDGSWKPVG